MRSARHWCGQDGRIPRSSSIWSCMPDGGVWDMSERKIFNAPFALKELTETGQFEGWAAVFSNIDRQGDIIRKGAFAESIAESGGGRWPVLFSHDSGRCCGFSTAASEDSKGLFVRGEFTLDSDEGRNAAATCRHAQSLGQKFGLSIGYRIRGKDGATFDPETNVRTLRNIEVLEFSVCPIPANDRARLAHV